MRPLVKPGLAHAWRDEHTVQVGVDPDNAVVVTDLEPGARAFLASLTGQVEVDDLLSRADRDGWDRPSALALLRVLDDAGVLDDADADVSALRTLSTAERDRLQPDLAARSLLGTGHGSGTEALRRRRAATVRIGGAGRVGAGIALLLAAAGIGHLVVRDDDKLVEPADVSPGGLRPVDVGRPRAAALRDLAKSVAPTAAVSTRGPASPDLVVLADERDTDRAETIGLVRDGVPHLVVAVREAAGVVGPFVLPGSTACLNCLDLHRTDVDPAWPAVLSQAQGAPRSIACDVGLASMVAGLAVLHVLAWLEGALPPSIDGTLSVALPSGRVRRRSWTPHRGCGCTWESVTTPVGPTVR